MRRSRHFPLPHAPTQRIIMKTDVQLKKDVIAELEWDPAVNATHVGVAVKDGVVTLTGHPNRPDPFEGRVRAFPLDFADAAGLTSSLPWPILRPSL